MHIHIYIYIYICCFFSLMFTVVDLCYVCLLHVSYWFVEPRYCTPRHAAVHRIALRTSPTSPSPNDVAYSVTSLARH